MNHFVLGNDYCSRDFWSDDKIFQNEISLRYHSSIVPIAIGVDTAENIHYNVRTSILVTVALWRSSTSVTLIIFQKFSDAFSIFNFSQLVLICSWFSAVGFGYIVRCLPFSLSFLFFERLFRACP